MSLMGKLIKWLIISILALLSIAVAASVAVVAFGITFNLDPLRPVVEAAVSTALDRKVKITGSVNLTPTLRPTLEIHGVEIDNPMEGWTDQVFASIDLARLQVGVPALLKKQIDVGEITAHKVTLNLETNKQGRNNWELGSAKDVETQPEAEKNTANSGKVGLQALDRLSLQDINVRYRDNSLGKQVTFQLDELSGSGEQGKLLELTGKGKFQKESYSFTIKGGALEDLQLRKQLYPLSIEGKIAGSPFTAKGEAGKDQKEKQLLLNLDMTLDKVDIGGLLAWLKLADGIEADTEELALQLKLRGNSLNTLATRSNLIFSLKGGNYLLRGAANGNGIPLAIDKGTVSILAGKPVTVNLDGMIDSHPINIGIHGMELVSYLKNPKQLPVSIKVDIADTVLDFNGKLALPVSSKNITLGMKLQGEKLNSLDQLLKTDLPPLGPYSLDAEFVMQEDGYLLPDLQLRIGDSDLIGSMSLNVAGAKPNAELKLSSKLLQLDDFRMGGWSPEGKTASSEEKGAGEDAKEVAAEQEKSDERNKEKREKAASLLSAESLARFNAHIDITLNRVMSGRDMLGNGVLKASLLDGKFSIDPLELQLAKGSTRTEFSYYPNANEVEIHLASTIDNFDIGILARRIKPETEMGGTFNMDLLLDTTASSLEQLFTDANGHVDFAFAPENLDASLVDLWAVNLVSSLASEADKGEESVINCVVASLAMDYGIMHERVIFMDTTNMSIEGEANINFKTRKLAIKAGPKAKRPEFFSMATPVKFSGTFEDFGIKINAARLTQSVASFVTSPVHVPLRRIFAKKRPEDGRLACIEAWENRNIDKE